MTFMLLFEQKQHKICALSMYIPLAWFKNLFSRYLRDFKFMQKIEKLDPLKNLGFFHYCW